MSKGRFKMRDFLKLTRLFTQVSHLMAELLLKKSKLHMARDPASLNRKAYLPRRINPHYGLAPPSRINLPLKISKHFQ
jgi:hypothetical protein